MSEYVKTSSKRFLNASRGGGLTNGQETFRCRDSDKVKVVLLDECELTNILNKPANWTPWVSSEYNYAELLWLLSL